MFNQKYIKALDTPVLQNKRVASLQSAAKSGTGKSSADGEDVIENLLENLDTPCRDFVRGIFKNASPDTPQTKRRRMDETPSMVTPEFLKTPYLEKQKSAYWDERRRENELTESEKNRKRSTVSINFLKQLKNIKKIYILLIAMD